MIVCHCHIDHCQSQSLIFYYFLPSFVVVSLCARLAVDNATSPFLSSHNDVVQWGRWILDSETSSYPLRFLLKVRWRKDISALTPRRERERAAAEVDTEGAQNNEEKREFFATKCLPHRLKAKEDWHSLPFLFAWEENVFEISSELKERSERREQRTVI